MGVATPFNGLDIFFRDILTGINSRASQVTEIEEFPVSLSGLASSTESTQQRPFSPQA